MTDQQLQGERLKTLLKLIHVSQSALSEQLGFTRGYISLLVNGEKPISQQLLNKLIKKFPTVNTHWLMSGDGIPIVEKGEVETYQIDEVIPTVEDPEPVGYGLFEKLQAEVELLRTGYDQLLKRLEELESKNRQQTND